MVPTTLSADFADTRRFDLHRQAEHGALVRAAKAGHARRGHAVRRRRARLTNWPRPLRTALSTMRPAQS